MNEIQENLKNEIGAAHSKALAAVEGARDVMSEAVNAKLYVATLVQKASRLHRHDINGYLKDHLSGPEIKDYMSLYDAARKRPSLQDKRQLQLSGLLDSQDVLQSATAPPKPQQGLITLITKTRQEMSKKLTARPVTEWSQSERAQVKDVLQPLQELYLQL